MFPERAAGVGVKCARYLVGFTNGRQNEDLGGRICGKDVLSRVGTAFPGHQEIY